MATEPAWLLARVDQRLTFFIESGALAGAQVTDMNLIMTPLTEPESDADHDRWDRTCDRCGTYSPPSQQFFTGMVQRKFGAVLVYIAYGVCATCKEKDDKGE